MDELLEIVGSDSRWKILKSLIEGPKDLRELSTELGMSVQGTMKHIALLEKSGLVKVSAGKDRRQKYALVGGVWIQRESDEQHELIFFFSSNRVNQESISSTPVSFRVHRLLKRCTNYLLKKGAADFPQHRSARPSPAGS
ncbi:MAG: winged helix-turn-helix transcriptional regulator [Nitrososphaerota archaeon]|jgi:predicted transcriptional regulator|nr:winged helix-turn-helix transcriptional regulator [Nitrososphaerota archaeon]